VGISVPPLIVIAAYDVSGNTETVNPTFFAVEVVPASQNTNAAMTAARMTVIATINITPMTGDTASSVVTALPGGDSVLTD